MSLSDELCRSYLDLRWHLDPAAATVAGAEGHDARLGAFDPESVGEHLAAFRAIEAGVEELDLADAADEIDRTALLDDIRVTIFRLQYERPHRRNPAFWLQHLCDALFGLLPADGNPDPARAAAALARLQAVPVYLRTAVETLREPPAALVEAARELGPPASRLVEELARQAGPKLDDGGEAMRNAAAEAESALERFRLALDAELSIHADEHAAATGLEEFERLLHHLHAVTAGASELWRNALHLEEEVEEELRGLAREAGRGDDWAAVLRQAVAEARPDEVLDAAAAELERARRFVAERDLAPTVAAPPLVARMPAHLAPVAGLAHYRTPPWGSSGAEGRLWLAPASSARAWASALAADQGVPGLHLLGERSAALTAEVRGRLVHRLTRGGWGLYAVEMLYEAAYWEAPRERILARSYLLLRALLARVDIGLHTKRFGPGEAIRMLRDRFPLEERVARALVWGAVLEPTQATGALLGRRELLRMRDAARRREGPSFRPAAHHEAVLAHGGLPAPLIRWGMDLEECR